MELNQIVMGDAISYLKSLPDNCVDAVITDPPYFRVKNELWDKQWESDLGFLNWINNLSVDLHRVLKPNGSLYCFASARMAARVELELSERFQVLNQIVWNKANLAKGGRHKVFCKEKLRSFFPATERIIFCEHYGSDNIAKGEAGYAAKCDELRGFVFEPLRSYLAEERRKSGATAKDIIKATGCLTVERHAFQRSQFELPTEANYLKLQKAFPGCYCREYEDLRREYEDLRREYEDLRREYEDLRRPFSVSSEVPYTDVWEFPTVTPRPGKHPCEKPLDLMRHIISSSTRPGDIILDPFMGSGTTAVACIETDRNFIGTEREPDHHAICLQRIEQAQLKRSV